MSILALTTALSAQTNTFPASGSVGIGTTTPQTALDVAGTIRTTGTLNVDSPSSTGFNATLNLVGRYNGTAETAQIYANFLGGLSINPSAGTPLVGINLNPTGGANFQVGGSAAVGYPNNTTAPANGLVVNGLVGIGTLSPSYNVDVTGSLRTTGSLNATGSGTEAVTVTSNNLIFNQYNSYIEQYKVGGDLRFLISRSSAIDTTAMMINNVGNVGIGTTSPGYPLTVNGAVRAKEVIVDTGWSDYVFDDNYTLAPLSEVEKRIKADHHLPGIPSAQEVTEKGISVGQMQAKLLAKMEEMTLYVIEQEKRSKAQEERILRLETENTALRSQNRQP